MFLPFHHHYVTINRVEYWIYQQTGTGKITPDRVARLEALGMDWDPQRSQWNFMFKKLEQFKEEVGHCKVPKVGNAVLYYARSGVYALADMVL